MAQILTVSCKLDASPEQGEAVDRTLEAFSGACNRIREIALERGIINKYRLQQYAYREVRERFGLSANLAIRAIARVTGALRGRRRVSQFRPTSIDYDQRIFRFRQSDWTVSLTLVGGTQRFRLVLGDYQRTLLAGAMPSSATLVRRRNGTLYLQIAVEQVACPSSPPRDFLGVDLGLRNLATLSTGERFGGSNTDQIRDRYLNLRSALQKKGTKGAKRLLKRLSGREKRYMMWLNHTMSARIIRFARAHDLAVVIEDLTGIQGSKVAKRAQRARHHRWAFRQLRAFLKYKGLRDGVPLIVVRPAFTSQTCHCCLHVGTRRGDRFSCRACGTSCHADLNAACTIAKLGASVTRPEHSLYCRLGMPAG